VSTRPKRLNSALQVASDDVTIRQLLSYRLHVVANLLSRGAAMRYKREFGMSLAEWRAIALLGEQAQLSLNELAKLAGLDKSQMSRVVSGLTGRGLVSRGQDENDGRGVQLSLSNAGARVYEGLIRAAAERNAAFLDCLTKAERDALESALAKLGAQARDFIEQEQLLAARPGRHSSPKKRNHPAAVQRQRLRVGAKAARLAAARRPFTRSP
jgi:DNA-binding MarR family transcriptional regulator